MSLTDPFSGMAAFITAARSNSFTEAGRQLGQTPSAVSKAIARLEDNLGVKLFNRSPRLISLTPEGEVFFSQCCKLLSTAQDARALVTGQNLSGSGHLRVCLPISFANQVIAQALPQWLKEHPAITLDLEITDRHVDLIQERFDLAFRFHVVPDSRLVAKKLPHPTFTTAASPDYWANRGRPTSPEELTQHSCLGYKDNVTQFVRPWEFRNERGLYRHFPSNQVSADQGAFLLSLAINGAGVIHAPEYLLSSALQKGQLESVLTDYQTKGPDWYLVYPYSRHPSLKLQAFITFLMSLLT